MDASQLPASPNIDDRRSESNSWLATALRQTMSDMQASAQAMPDGLRALFTHPFTQMPFGQPIPPVDGQLSIDAGVNAIGGGNGNPAAPAPNMTRKPFGSWSP